MKMAIILATSISLAIPALSAIGETKSECDKTHGTPTGFSKDGRLTFVEYTSPGGVTRFSFLKNGICVSAHRAYEQITKQERNAFILRNLKKGELLAELKEKRSELAGMRIFYSPASKRTVILGKGYVEVNSESYYLIKNQDEAYARIRAERKNGRNNSKTGNPFSPYEPDFYAWQERQKEKRDKARRLREEQARRNNPHPLPAIDRQEQVRKRQLALSYRKEQALVNVIAGAIRDAANIINQNGGNISYGLGALQAPINEGDFQSLESTWSDCVQQAAKYNVRVDHAVTRHIQNLRHLRNER